MYVVEIHRKYLVEHNKGLVRVSFSHVSLLFLYLLRKTSGSKYPGNNCIVHCVS